jgi:hypothetical protein
MLHRAVIVFSVLLVRLASICNCALQDIVKALLLHTYTHETWYMSVNDPSNYIY